jgi:DNA-binding NarL/FixJ family response regulator
MAIPKVLIADDHTIVAQGLELMLKESFNFIGTVTDGRALLEAA